MAGANDLYGSIYQNLPDAGCGQQVAEPCMTFVKDGKCVDMLPTLTGHRKSLPGVLHKGQEQTDCPDYLLDKIKKI